MDGEGFQRRLDAAVTLGIISREQAMAIRELAPEDTAASVEAPRAFNPATLAYVLGAVTVLVAMGWFLGDRWEWLGAGGVLAVALLYTTLFLVVARRLTAEGFPQAAGFSVLLAVLMTPVAMVALSELTGWFVTPSRVACQMEVFDILTCRGEEIAVELVTALVALLALRRIRFSLLVVPLVVIGVRFLFHAGDAFWRGGHGTTTAGWVWMIGASALTAIAYLTERRQRGGEDFALWIHLAAVVSAGVASVILINVHREFRHLLVPGAVVAFAFSLRMRRFPWLLLGMAWFVGYLAWLAGDVFDDTPFFPIVLAALGVGMIIATVWAQRNSALLVARLGGVTTDNGPSFPGGIPLLLLPAVVALLQLPGAAEFDRAQLRANQAAQKRWRATARAEQLEAARETGDTKATKETTGRPPP
jgi:hypothetical protein